MPKILMIDEHSVYRSGLRTLIPIKIEAATIFDVPSIKNVDDRAGFDLVLLDAGIFDRECALFMKEVRTASPNTRFALMSQSRARSDVIEAISTGFHGFICKMDPEADLFAAIKDLLSGRIYVPRWVADDDGGNNEILALEISPMERLKITARQREILYLLAQGMSNKEISRILQIAEGTAKIHTTALLRALGARNRTEAATVAAKLLGSAPQAMKTAGGRIALDKVQNVRARPWSHIFG